MRHAVMDACNDLLVVVMFRQTLAWIDDLKRATGFTVFVWWR